MTHAPAIALLMLSAWVQSSPGREIAAWSVLRGTPVAVALAVHETETGNVPEEERIHVDVHAVVRVLVGVLRDPCAPAVARDVGISAQREDNPTCGGRLHHRPGLNHGPLGHAAVRPTRDSVISSGNVGRMQINASTWCPVLGLPRATCVRALQQRHVNVQVGVAVLARVQRKYTPGPRLADVAGCRCGRPHAGGWVSHYNAGTLVQAGSRGERYGNRVVYKVRRMTAGGARW